MSWITDLFNRKREPEPTFAKVEVPLASPSAPTSGRSSIHDHLSVGGFITDLISENPEYNIELLRALENLATYNADFSLAVENIAQLGKTPYKIYFDESLSDTKVKEMLLLIRDFSKKWYNGNDSVTSLIGDLYAEAIITGAISAEVYPVFPDKNIRIVLVHPRNVRFRYNQKTDLYEPLQVNTLNKTDGFGYHPLNPETYKYYAIRRYAENYYAIPPFLAALETISIERDMLTNFKSIVKKLGLFGFLSVLVRLPAKKQNETDEAHKTRIDAYLQAVGTETQKGFAQGLVVGYKGEHEFSMDGSLANPQGARELFEANTEMKAAGLKQSPAMLGRNYSTTETLARVMLAMLTTQVGSYQQLVANFLEDAFKMFLNLNGYPVKYLTVEFERPLITDQLKDEQAYQTKILNYQTLYNLGIISQEQVAQALGYEVPDQKKPRIPLVPPTAKTAKSRDDGGEAERRSDPGKTKKTTPDGKRTNPS